MSLYTQNEIIKVVHNKSEEVYYYYLTLDNTRVYFYCDDKFEPEIVIDKLRKHSSMKEKNATIRGGWDFMQELRALTGNTKCGWNPVHAREPSKFLVYILFPKPILKPSLWCLI